jgi:hypothetical protein
LLLNRCDKAIAPAGYTGDVPRTVLAIAQHSTKTSNVDTEICVIDNDAGPDPLTQLLMSDYFARPLHQRDQKVERTTPDRKRIIAFLQ